MPHPSIKTTRAFSPWRRTVGYKQCVSRHHVSKHVHFWTPTIGETFEPENPTKACVRCCSDDKFHRGRSRTEEYLRITLNISVPKRKHCSRGKRNYWTIYLRSLIWRFIFQNSPSAKFNSCHYLRLYWWHETRPSVFHEVVACETRLVLEGGEVCVYTNVSAHYN